MEKISSIQKAAQIFGNMGLRYVAFRSAFELKKRTGLLEKQFPVNPRQVAPISLEEWRQKKKPFFPKPNDNAKVDKQLLAAEANRIRNGEILYFSSKWYSLGNQYDWVTNPESGYRYDASVHWTRINDYSKEAGDIKYVWEKSRFSFVYALIRDNHWNKNDHAEFVFSEIDKWLAANPVNCGPNYKCSQEISLRVINWIFTLYYYSDHPALTADRWERILNAIHWQTHHVFGNINFSRIAVRNNHAITETLALYLVGTLFPWFSDSAEWKDKGKRWFEREVAYQVYPDGTFLQFSMNYHRVLIQLLTFGIGIAARNGERFKEVVYQRAYLSLNFLYQCQDDETGMLPNYGANDGALFFPFSNSGFRDYRPQLNALHIQLCGNPLYGDGPQAYQEDALWMNGGSDHPGFAPLQKEDGCISFPAGGYYLIRDNDSLTFIRCGNHKDRPSQADNLHVDIWVKGENVLRDAGSYRYNADEATLRYFMGSASHNTVMIDQYDQMLKGARFIWYYWTRCSGEPVIIDKGGYFEFKGAIEAFRHLGPGIVHQRIIRKTRGKNQWVITDEVSKKPAGAALHQLWHVAAGNRPGVRMEASDGATLQSATAEGWYSEKYGMKEPAPAQVFTTSKSKIETNLSIE